MFNRLIALMLLVSACSDTPLGTHEKLQIAQAEQRWKERRPASYSFEVRVSCFCAPQLGGWTEVTVVGEAVTSAKPLTPVLGDLEPLPLDAWPTVSELFDVLKRTRDDSYVKDVSATYDSQFGYPTDINITCTPDIMDCGTHYSARNLRAVQ